MDLHLAWAPDETRFEGSEQAASQWKKGANRSLVLVQEQSAERAWRLAVARQVGHLCNKGVKSASLAHLANELSSKHHL